MKTCPVCKTQVFDDMDACYGCMYQFIGAVHSMGNALTAASASGADQTVPLVPGQYDVNQENQKMNMRDVQAEISHGRHAAHSSQKGSAQESIDSYKVPIMPLAPAVKQSEQREQQTPTVVTLPVDADSGCWIASLELRVIGNPAQRVNAELYPSEARSC